MSEDQKGKNPVGDPRGLNPGKSMGVFSPKCLWESRMLYCSSGNVPLNPTRKSPSGNMSSLKLVPFRYSFRLAGYQNGKLCKKVKKKS